MNKLSKNLFALFLAGTLLTSCGGAKETVEAAPKEAVVPALNPATEQLALSVLWQQTSLEAKYLYVQGYELAKLKLQQNLNDPKASPELGNAIILDIDETVLDNSYYEALLVKSGESYNPDTWTSWVELASAPALPGAVEFIRFARQHEVEVYFISNRSVEMMQSTVTNLLEVGIETDEEHLFLKREPSGNKEERRQRIQMRYNVLLYVGDQLTDFSEVFERTEEASHIFETLTRTNDDGEIAPAASDMNLLKYFVIMPNPMYGSFETGLYENERGLNDKRKSELRKNALKTESRRRR